ncbi:MAG: L,D-transpeptidase family protein [Gammaproteobacteria bacterium]|nr:L,D-transpeptidase family protein [Gammaproteobacteria bacterium]
MLPTAFILPDVPRQGIVVNLSERRLYYFDTENAQLSVFPAGIGREGSATPTIKTQTVARIENPEWTPPASVRREHAARGKTLPAVVPAGPDNPLGKYAIKLASPGYFIHGTNQSFGVGQRVSQGCIRLYNPHIESLIKAVPNGTPVQILNQPHKVGWHQGSLYLESYPTNAESEHSNHLTQAVGLIIKATKQSTVSIDWRLATQVARAGTGLPTRISN